MLEQDIQELISRQRQFFASGQTRDLDFRLEALRRLKKSVLEYEQEIIDSMAADNEKPLFESYMTELVLTVNEINHAVKNLRKWMKPTRAGTSIFVFPSRSYIVSEPYGVALIMGSWNFPFLLVFSPLVGAIAAGNCCIVQTSGNSLAAGVIEKMIATTFATDHVAVAAPGLETSKHLVGQRFDKILFTGGHEVGKIIMAKAAQYLTPVTLELGGKSPCIVDKNIDVDITARRILHGKLRNAGQACIAPDYLLVHQDIKERFYAALYKSLQGFYPEGPNRYQDMAAIINIKNYLRVKSYLTQGQIVIGGGFDDERLMIEPTIMEMTDLDQPVMQEEIYGPILPVLEYTSLSQAAEIIAHNPNPLGLYIFSKDQRVIRWVIENVPFGGGCVNDTQYHFANSNLPFGGRGTSGMGNYHGRFGFDTFSHQKAVLHKGFGFDLPIYPPYKDKHKYWRMLLR